MCLGPVWDTLTWLVAATAVLLLSSLAAAWAIGRSIARSIHELAAPALALGAGVPVTVPRLHLREVEEVGRALTSASEMLMAAQHKANHDILTGLANRALFQEILNHQLAICKRADLVLSIVYIDLDGFKLINDSYGHAIGDELLCGVARRLEAAYGIRPGGPARRRRVCARPAQDRIGDGTGHGAQADRKSFRPNKVGSLTLKISASIGIAAYPEVGGHQRGARAARRHGDVQGQDAGRS